jgi:hypothetical protein
MLPADLTDIGMPARRREIRIECKAHRITVFRQALKQSPYTSLATRSS